MATQVYSKKGGKVTLSGNATIIADGEVVAEGNGTSKPVVVTGDIVEADDLGTQSYKEPTCWERSQREQKTARAIFPFLVIGFIGYVSWLAFAMYTYANK